MPKVLLVEDDNNLREIFDMRLRPSRGQGSRRKTWRGKVFSEVPGYPRGLCPGSKRSYAA
jgi:hypothetical protein